MSIATESSRTRGWRMENGGWQVTRAGESLCCTGDNSRAARFMACDGENLALVGGRVKNRRAVGRSCVNVGLFF